MPKPAKFIQIVATPPVETSDGRILMGQVFALDKAGVVWQRKAEKWVAYTEERSTSA